MEVIKRHLMSGMGGNECEMSFMHVKFYGINLQSTLRQSEGILHKTLSNSPYRYRIYDQICR